MRVRVVRALFVLCAPVAAAVDLDNLGDGEIDMSDLRRFRDWHLVARANDEAEESGSFESMDSSDLLIFDHKPGRDYGHAPHVNPDATCGPGE